MVVGSFGEYPQLDALCKAVIDVWPAHENFIQRSMSIRGRGLLATSNVVADAILTIAGDRLSEYCQHYKDLADIIREEEINFVRTGKYRYSSFLETNANVYSNDDLMNTYMHGLLLSHVLWFMHASSLHFYRQRLDARLVNANRVLEVGSGHGLMLYLALKDFGLTEAHAWDLSEVSLEQTRETLALLGEADRTHFAIQDMHDARGDGEQFDLLILSHILEHLDDPVDALVRMKPVLGRTGRLFVNVPLNAPMPDHVILLESPDEARTLIEKGGFRILEMGSHTTQGVTLAKALKQKTAVTCSIIAEPA